MTDITYALAVLSAITYGSADFLGGLAAKNASTFAVVVISQFAGLILMLLSLPFLPSASPTAIDIAWGAASGLAGGTGVALLYRGLAIGVMSVVAPVTAVCAVIIPLTVGLVIGERPATPSIAGILLAVMAIVLVSQSGRVEDGKLATAGLGISIASGVAIGIFLVCLQRSGSSAGLWPLIMARGVAVILFIMAGVISRQALVPPRRALLTIVGAGALDMAANVLYLLAVREGMLSMVATLTSLYPASTIILARLVLRERLRPLQQLGVACAAMAIVLIVAA